MPRPTTRVMQASSWWDCPRGRVSETRSGVALPQLASVSWTHVHWELPATEPSEDSLFAELWLGTLEWVLALVARFSLRTASALTACPLLLQFHSSLRLCPHTPQGYRLLFGISSHFKNRLNTLNWYVCRLKYVLLAKLVSVQALWLSTQANLDHTVFLILFHSGLFLFSSSSSSVSFLKPSSLCPVQRLNVFLCCHRWMVLLNWGTGLLWEPLPSTLVSLATLSAATPPGNVWPLGCGQEWSRCV